MPTYKSLPSGTHVMLMQSMYTRHNDDGTSLHLGHFTPTELHTHFIRSFVVGDVLVVDNEMANDHNITSLIPLHSHQFEYTLDETACTQIDETIYHVLPAQYDRIGLIMKMFLDELTIEQPDGKFQLCANERTIRHAAYRYGFVDQIWPRDQFPTDPESYRNYDETFNDDPEGKYLFLAVPYTFGEVGSMIRFDIMNQQCSIC